MINGYQSNTPVKGHGWPVKGAERRPGSNGEMGVESLQGIPQKRASHTSNTVVLRNSAKKHRIMAPHTPAVAYSGAPILRTRAIHLLMGCAAGSCACMLTCA